MPARKRAAPAEESELAPRRRSARQSAIAEAKPEPVEKKPSTVSKTKNKSFKPLPPPKDAKPKPAAKEAVSKDKNEKKVNKSSAKPSAKKVNRAPDEDAGEVSDDPDVDSIPTTNPEAPRHDGEWYWLLKAEPESRFENGIDVKFSIDDLKAKTKPEGWDGIRNYAARNNMRNMNAGDKAFFYHSNCKEPGIAGIMEIVKEYSEDKSARRPGTPYYDPKSTKDKRPWSLVHVSFLKKFAVPIGLKELRELGAASGSPLAEMHILKFGRMSVTKVSAGEWKYLCDLADKKAKEAGLKHEER